MPFEENHSNILNTLNSNGIKLDFIVSPCDSPNWTENFNFLKLGDYKFCIAVPINHPLAKKETISFEDLLGEKVTTITTGDSKQNQDILNKIKTICKDVEIYDAPFFYDINVFNKGSVELLSFKLEKGSILHDMKVQEIRAKLKFDILVCMVERGEEVIIPNGEFILKENDIISIIAPHKKATEFFVKIGMIKNPVKNSMLIGGGDISYYLAKRLIKYGIDVTLVEKDEKRCEELSELIPELELELNKQQEKNNPLDYKSWQLTKSQKLEIQKQSKEIAKKHAEKGDNKENINDFELEQK